MNVVLYYIFAFGHSVCVGECIEFAMKEAGNLNMKRLHAGIWNGKGESTGLTVLT